MFSFYTGSIINVHDAGTRYVRLSLFIPIACFVRAKVNTRRVRAVHPVQEKCAESADAARPEPATTRNSLSAVGGGQQLHAAIFSA